MKYNKTVRSSKNHRMNDAIDESWNTWKPFFMVAIFIRLLLSNMPPYAVDMGGYVAWSRYLADYGPVGFYKQFHVVYAPFYQYLLWISGEIVAFFQFGESAHMWLIKLWSVAADISGSYLVIQLGKKILSNKKNTEMKLKSNKEYQPTQSKLHTSNDIYTQNTAKRLIHRESGLFREKRNHSLGEHAIFALSMFYMMNPAVFFNSSIWGQFDGIPALLLTISLYFFIEKNPLTAAMFFLLSVLTKPQSALLLPIIVILFIVSMQLYKDKPLKQVFLWLSTIISGLSLYLVVVLPFYDPTPMLTRISKWLDPFYWIFHLYLQSVQDYPYATANAFNFWFLINKQIVPDNTLFLGLSLSAWGLFLFICCTAFAIWILLKGKMSPPSIFMASWFTLLSAFLFVTKMHERYLVPALLIGLVCVLYEKKLLFPYILCSIGTMINQWVLYSFSFETQYWLPANHFIAKLCALLLLFAFVWTVKILFESITADNQV